MAWSGFGQTQLVRKQADVKESSSPVSGRMQPARYQFPTFRLGCVLPQTARIILCKTSPDPTWFWLTVSGLGQTDPVRKQAGEQGSSGPLLANASGMFTGNEPWQNIYQARHKEATSWDCCFIEIEKSLEKVSGALS